MKNKKLKNCLLIGYNAGLNLKDVENKVIIGDNIKDLNPENNGGVLFLGDSIAIGETIFGKKCNLKELLYSEYYPINPNVSKDEK